MKKKWLLPIFASFMLFTTTNINNAEAASTSDVSETATKYLGIPYLYGGTTTSGLDCSGFTSKVFADLGIKLNRTSGSQYQQGTAVDKSDLQVGDLLFFNTSGSGISHVAIYIGDGKMVHSQTGKGVSYSNVNDPYYWGSRYVGAKRVATFDSAQQEAVVAQAEVKEAAIDFSVYASRAEVAEQIAKALSLDTSDKNTKFADVKPTYAHAGAIAAVAKLGIFEGDSNGKFNPSSPMTRAQAAKVLVKAFGLAQNGDVVTFADATADHWANEFVSILASNGITTNNDNFGYDDMLKVEHLKTFIERITEIK
ncbi:C40 family peptidase [Lysinibacillus piscis]|uniref:Peptidase n=1 Tax=Lysinibacillus piscis TaxID=2518931 RepID=A0ABQ5NIG3_9BACI|nr:C40 family peptidase [Lysinibacillus sp. KH24]GLC87861.1 hypothetical protein LYSBPC_09880 [Lysinibacillus sp. KH24]